jgi:Ca2+-binding EF-hand superfamily protein
VSQRLAFPPPLLSHLFAIALSTDSDKSGSISTEELGEMFKTLGYETSVEELTQLIRLVDADGNGALDFDEFVSLMDLFLQHPTD